MPNPPPNEATLNIRPARPEDLGETYEVMLEANEDLNRRLGRSVDIAARSPAERAMAVRRLVLQTDPERFLVSEGEGGIQGFGMATIRDGVWYLAALHVRPGSQKAGLGGWLLSHLVPGRDDDVEVMVTISESLNPASNGLYGGHGLYPQTPVLMLSGPPRPFPIPTGLKVAEPASPRDLTEVDRQVLGMSRPEDHECWQGVESMRCLMLASGNKVVAYGYIDASGSVGPAAAADPETLIAMVGTLIRTGLAAEKEAISVYVPGIARPLLATLLAAGFRYKAGMNLVLTSSPFGRLDRYVMSGSDALF